MPEAGPQDDIKLKVTLDDRDVESGVGRMKTRFREMASTAGRRLAQAGFGVAAGVAAGMTAPVVGDLWTIGRGVTGVFGREFSRQLGIREKRDDIEAAMMAQQETIRSLGMAAVGMSPQGIEQLFEVHRRMARLRLAGQAQVEKVTDVKVANIGKTLEEAATYLKEATNDMRMLFQQQFNKFGR